MSQFRRHSWGSQPSRARVDISGISSGHYALSEFISELEGLVGDAPKIQRLLHEEIANELKRTLDSSISSALNDSRGHVKAWQEKHVGSGGGYAAVRPAKGTVSRGKKSYRVAAITAYLEDGHKLPRPRGGSANNYRYRSRIKAPYVNGRHFYRNTGYKFERAAIYRAQSVADEIAKRLNGG